ncbi:hypothetical protein B0H14DRAFT_3577110 [Mycena olivaceomarginata]|nr:hypothetical protein B0H14DRAFT_3577110 [Mycena olivaceomarginata]
MSLQKYLLSPLPPRPARCGPLHRSYWSIMLLGHHSTSSLHFLPPLALSFPFSSSPFAPPPPSTASFSPASPGPSALRIRPSSVPTLPVDIRDNGATPSRVPDAHVQPVRRPRTASPPARPHVCRLFPPRSTATSTTIHRRQNTLYDIVQRVLLLPARWARPGMICIALPCGGHAAPPAHPWCDRPPSSPHPRPSKEVHRAPTALPRTSLLTCTHPASTPSTLLQACFRSPTPVAAPQPIRGLRPAVIDTYRVGAAHPPPPPPPSSESSDVLGADPSSSAPAHAATPQHTPCACPEVPASSTTYFSHRLDVAPVLMPVLSVPAHPLFCIFPPPRFFSPASSPCLQMDVDEERRAQRWSAPPIALRTPSTLYSRVEHEVQPTTARSSAPHSRPFTQRSPYSSLTRYL